MLIHYTFDKPFCQIFSAFLGIYQALVKTLHNFIHNQWITLAISLFFNIKKLSIACG